MGRTALLVACCCILVAHACAQYQDDELESGRLQPRPGRIRISGPGQQGGGGALRQGISVGPRTRRPIPIGAFQVPQQGAGRGRQQGPPPIPGAIPAPLPQQTFSPQALRPAPVREDPPQQNAITQPTFSAPVEEDIDDEDDEVTPGVYPSTATPPQYAPVPQAPRATTQPPQPYRPPQTVRQSRPQPAFRPESRSSLQPQFQEAPVRQSRPQPRPVAAPAPQQTGGNSRERAPVSLSVRRYREDRPDGSIVWGFENDDGSFKEEVIGADCIVRGKYGYIDPDGVRREYTYTSGNPCERDEEGRLIPDEGALDNGQYNLPQGANDFNLNVKNKSRRPKQ
ncbi:basic salivary proline-rich protein 2-like [Ischnura elegans]|uniref:basic salivary proline-rich protein 2-like n=1 Tax=Ischnura elegans TaxID=197161 RepID=UPI001ED8AA63|nr:basic salivary proline-rich protein 2-like [Ischnura elegans]